MGGGPPCGKHIECEPHYRLKADVIDSASQWNPCDAAIQRDFDRRRQAAARACSIAAAGAHQGSGAYCLPHLVRDASPPRVSSGRVRWVELPNNQSYLLPFDVAPFRSAHHVEADGRVVAGLLALAVAEQRTGEIFLNDFGAGVGQYGRSLLAHRPAHAGSRHQDQYRGFDGSGNIRSWTDGLVRWFDLTMPALALPRAQWVLSVEVGEHIPPEWEGVYLRNLHAHNCHGIILSWAAAGQRGQGHINNHGMRYVRGKLEGLGYRVNESLTERMGRGRPMQGMPIHDHLTRNLAVFERRQRISPCVPTPGCPGGRAGSGRVGSGRPGG